MLKSFVVSVTGVALFVFTTLSIIHQLPVEASSTLLKSVYECDYESLEIVLETGDQKKDSFSQPCILPKHDSGKGKLISAHVVLKQEVVSHVMGENVTPEDLLAQGDWKASTSIPEINPTLESVTPFSVGLYLDSYDGTKDYTGLSGWNFPITIQENISKITVEDDESLTLFSSDNYLSEQTLTLSTKNQIEKIKQSDGVEFLGKFLLKSIVTVEYEYSAQDLLVSLNGDEPVYSGIEKIIRLDVINNNDFTTEGGVIVTLTSSENLQIVSIESEDFEIFSQDPITQLKHKSTLSPFESSSIYITFVTPQLDGQPFFFSSSVRGEIADGNLENNYSTLNFITNHKPVSADSTRLLPINSNVITQLPDKLFKGIDSDGKVIGYVIHEYSFDTGNGDVSEVESETVGMSEENGGEKNSERFALFNGNPNNGGLPLSRGSYVENGDDLFVIVGDEEVKSLSLFYSSVDDSFESGEMAESRIDFLIPGDSGVGTSTIPNDSNSVLELARTGSGRVTFEANGFWQRFENGQYLPLVVIFITLITFIVGEMCVWVKSLYGNLV